MIRVTVRLAIRQLTMRSSLFVKRVGSDEWRSKAQILGISTQMALVVPFAVNSRHRKAPPPNGGKL